MQFEEYALKLNAGDFASRSKAKAKPQKRDCQLIHKNFTHRGKSGLMLSQKIILQSITQCQNN